MCFCAARKRRRGGGVALIQQIEGVDGSAVNLLGIGQDALLRFQFLVFSRTFSRPQMRLFDFTCLKVPQVQQAHAILLILFELSDAAANMLPMCERRGNIF